MELLIHTGADPDVRAGPRPGPGLGPGPALLSSHVCFTDLA